MAEAEAFEALAGKLDRLQSDNRSDNLGRMVPLHRLTISAGRGNGGPIKEAALKAGYSLRSLATKMGVSQSLLSQIDAGKKTLSPAISSKMRTVIGYPPAE